MSLRAESLYAQVMVEGQEHWWLVDTGAECSVIKKGVLRGNRKHHGVSLLDFKGERSAGHGCAEIEVEIGGKPHELKVVVADIRDQGILGLNLLHAMRAHINLPKMAIIGDDIHVELRTKGEYCSGGGEAEGVTVNATRPCVKHLLARFSDETPYGMQTTRREKKVKNSKGGRGPAQLPKVAQ